MQLFYQLGICLYGWLLFIASAFHPKARAWWVGRRGWQVRLRQSITALPPASYTLWMHCASLGEFEQGRPVLEEFRTNYPDARIVLTFFSPSGYQVRHNYKGADVVCYLPLDTPHNARTFIDSIKPNLALFVKYDLWYNYLRVLKKSSIPAILISAVVRNTSGLKTIELRWRKGFLYKLLSHVFVRDEASLQAFNKLLATVPCTLAGDTRFDRVATVAKSSTPDALIAHFIGGRFCLVAGSTWPADLTLILKAWQAFQHAHSQLPVCLVLVPHELQPPPQPTMILYSELQAVPSVTQPILWVDKVGLLAALYKLADLVLVGGGFGAGIHNTLEPAVYGKRILFGPRYSKFPEANELIRLGAARCITKPTELQEELEAAHSRAPAYLAAGQAAVSYVQANTGATAKILAALQNQHLLPHA